MSTSSGAMVLCGHFRATGNNEIVAQSEAYSSLQAAKNGVKEQAHGATEQDLTGGR